MARKGTRLREFEKNHRVLDITGAQEERKKKRRKSLKDVKTIAGDPSVAGEDTVFSADRAEEKKKKPRSWVKLAGMVICAVFLFAVAASVKNIYDLREREQTAATRNKQLEEMKEELLVELENVNSDEYIEEKARRELKLIRPSELVFYFPNNFSIENQEADSEADEAGGSGETVEAENDGGSKN